MQKLLKSLIFDNNEAFYHLNLQIYVYKNIYSIKM